MSEKTEVSYQAALDYLNREVYAPIFFSKLAQDYGIQPKDNDEATRYIKLAADVQTLNSSKPPSSDPRKNFLDTVEARLHGEVSKSAAYVDQGVKNLAAQLASQPTYRDAALLVHDAFNQSN